MTYQGNQYVMAYTKSETPKMGSIFGVSLCLFVGASVKPLADVM